MRNIHLKDGQPTALHVRPGQQVLVSNPKGAMVVLSAHTDGTLAIAPRGVTGMQVLDVQDVSGQKRIRTSASVYVGYVGS